MKAITRKIPQYIPALKIAPTISQEESKTAAINAKHQIISFMIFFTIQLQKAFRLFFPKATIHSNTLLRIVLILIYY
jgi:hypothetical protein